MGSAQVSAPVLLQAECVLSSRLSLPEDAGKYFDKESRVLEAPMTIRVTDQVCVGHSPGMLGTHAEAGPWRVPGPAAPTRQP